MKKRLGIDKRALIFPIVVIDNNNAINIQEYALKHSFLLGAIRTPTVKKAIIRFIGIISSKKIDDVLTLLSLKSNEN